MSLPVIHDNDGHVDDLLAALLLWLAPGVDLQAVTITAGDSYPDQSFSAFLKMATFLDLEGPEIAYSEDEVVNPFPDSWRSESRLVNGMPLFSEISLKSAYQQGPVRKSHSVISDCLSHTKEPITIVSTGPLTNVAKVFDDRPELKSKVKEFVIMGGAINVPGNVEQDNSDGSAEWNLYADPPAAKTIFDLNVPIKLVSLDVTNQLPFSKDFLERVQAQAETSRASRLAATLWSLVKSIQYYFWDTLTVACVIRPSLFEFKDVKVDVLTSGMSQGKTAGRLLGGRKVKFASTVDKDGFKELLLELLRSR
jgi:purine nucleosidase